MSEFFDVPSGCVSILSLIPKSHKILFKKAREKISLYPSYFHNIENGDTGFKMG